MQDEYAREKNKAVVGACLIILAALVMYLGSDSHFGYIKQSTFLSIMVIFPLIGYGGYLVGRWFQYLTEYNNKHRY